MLENRLRIEVDLKNEEGKSGHSLIYLFNRYILNVYHCQEEASVIYPPIIELYTLFGFVFIKLEEVYSFILNPT